MFDMYNAGRLMQVLCSDCTKLPIRELKINIPMQTAWCTGVFTMVVVRDCSGEKGLMVNRDMTDVVYDFLFKVECIKLEDSNSCAAAVILRLADSHGPIWPTIKVSCPEEVFDELDLAGLGLYMRQNDESRSGEHVVYDEEGRDPQEITLVEDLPRCRKVVESLCRELTDKLWKKGYFLRPVDG